MLLAPRTHASPQAVVVEAPVFPTHQITGDQVRARIAEAAERLRQNFRLMQSKCTLYSPA
jgi:hypothetical protein